MTRFTFAERSSEAELLDAPDIPADLLHRNLRELHMINERLGGHAITMHGLEQLIQPGRRRYHIADLGCGGGDTLRAMADWGRRRKLFFRLTGVDINSDAIHFLKQHCQEYPEIKAVQADYRNYLSNGPEVDIIHCALFCHHLTDEENIELLQYMHRHARVGFIINDLHRHPLAYYGIKALTRMLGGSSLVRNDAPLSVLRSFRYDELKSLLERAGIKHYFIRWKWAFRYLVIVPS
ncbi:Methyltransferase domain-containing protein [Catalinimonas alkaloidigena]|uniref:Methyltransferase domain-containing protein n=1 Tax=Catalinimonas alkaloidigena TaxID=1075417 RepID=A0A1G9QL18_9BACT|nr:methyltransferase domain-containing protein [Catalinimonas alkaloidigena]SDM11541.1 Methyltransferase domain-containing protein [Catalinimonas alkaloidigena]